MATATVSATRRSRTTTRSGSRVTSDAHVWRVRDHATHALLKEFVPERVPGAPEMAKDLKPAKVPDVVLRAGDPALPESEPVACSHGGQPVSFDFKNERDEQVVVMWVGLDCREKYWDRIEPGKSHAVKGVDADAWRVRDAKTGALLYEITPERPDTTTYVTVP